MPLNQTKAKQNYDGNHYAKYASKLFLAMVKA